MWCFSIHTTILHSWARLEIVPLTMILFTEWIHGSLAKIGNIRNDNGNTDENVTWKYKFLLIESFRDYSNSLDVYNEGNYPGTKFVGTACRLKKRMKNLPSCTHVLQKTFNLVIAHCRSLFIVLLSLLSFFISESARRCIKMYNSRAERLCLLNKPIVLRHSRYPGLRPCLSFLITPPLQL